MLTAILWSEHYYYHPCFTDEKTNYMMFNQLFLSEVAQPCPTLCDPVDCSPPSSVGFSRQEYCTELPFPSPGESSQPKDWTLVSHIAGKCFNLWATREAQIMKRGESKMPPSLIWKVAKMTLHLSSTVTKGEPSSIFLTQKENYMITQ